MKKYQIINSPFFALPIVKNPCYAVILILREFCDILRMKTDAAFDWIPG